MKFYANVLDEEELCTFILLTQAHDGRLDTSETKVEKGGTYIRGAMCIICADIPDSKAESFRQIGETFKLISHSISDTPSDSD